jgi:dTDP-glucose pyrophosphorylase
MERIISRTIQGNQTLLDALKQMDVQKVKSLFVFDNDIFLGLLTVGDIQRAIIANTTLSECITIIIDKNKLYATPSQTKNEIKETMLELRAECMPVINSFGELVNVFFWDDFFPTPHHSVLPQIDVPVVIMAGGKGTRLLPLTNVIPKPLIPIGEKTIIEIIIDKFSNMGCRSFYISTGYKSDILKYYLDSIGYPYQIEYFNETTPRGTIGSVALLKNRIDKPFFVSNCDILIDQDLSEVYNYHIKNKNDITTVVAIKSHKIPYGVVKTSENGLLESLEEKPDLTYMINTGIYILNPGLIDQIPAEGIFHITHLIERVQQKGGRVGCYPVSEGAWTDIGEWREYLKLVDLK